MKHDLRIVPQIKFGRLSHAFRLIYSMHRLIVGNEGRKVRMRTLYKVKTTFLSTHSNHLPSDKVLNEAKVRKKEDATLYRECQFANRDKIERKGWYTQYIDLGKRIG